MAIDTTVVSPLRRGGSARLGAANANSQNAGRSVPIRSCPVKWAGPVSGAWRWGVREVEF